MRALPDGLNIMMSISWTTTSNSGAYTWPLVRFLLSGLPRPDDFCAVDTSSWRVGQIPQFLDVEQDRWTDGDIALSVSHHAQFFAKYTGTTFNRCVGGPRTPDPA